ncbi:MAG TPA: hypothetical protein VK894_08315 [Jiangellales bacterium]|nr:hypothetical protein [Jiangellales bacterium]
MTTILTPSGPPDTGSPTSARHDRRRIWFVLLAVALAVAVAFGVWAFRSSGGDDVAVPEPAAPVQPAPGGAEEPGSADEPAVVPQPSAPGQPSSAAADCAVAPGREYYTVGASHPCFRDMGERFLVWLGGAAYHQGGSYEPSTVFSVSDVGNVRAVQLLMDDVPDGWFGPSQWTRLMTQGPPPVTQLRASGIGPLWFGMTAEQVEATGVARVLTTEEGPVFLQVEGIDGAGCYAKEPSGGGVITAFLTSDPAVSTPEGVTSRSTVDQVLAAYAGRVTTRVQQVTTSKGFLEVTLYVVPDGDFALAMWAPPPELGPDSPLMLASGTRGMVDDLQLQSGWCMD